MSTLRNAILAVIRRAAAYATQRPLSAGDLQPEGSLAPIPAPIPPPTDHLVPDPTAYVSAATIPLPPQPRCAYPTDWGFDWMLSHRWVAAFGSLTCQACGMIWPKPKGEA